MKSITLTQRQLLRNDFSHKRKKAKNNLPFIVDTEALAFRCSVSSPSLSAALSARPPGRPAESPGLVACLLTPTFRSDPDRLLPIPLSTRLPAFLPTVSSTWKGRRPSLTPLNLCLSKSNIQRNNFVLSLG